MFEDTGRCTIFDNDSTFKVLAKNLLDEESVYDAGNLERSVIRANDDGFGLYLRIEESRRRNSPAAGKCSMLRRSAGNTRSGGESETSLHNEATWHERDHR